MEKEKEDCGLIILSASSCKACHNLQDWLDSEKILYTALDVDEDDTAADIATKYKIRSIPATFIINSREEVVEYKIGWSEDIKTWIKSHV